MPSSGLGLGLALWCKWISSDEDSILFFTPEMATGLLSFVPSHLFSGTIGLVAQVSIGRVSPLCLDYTALSYTSAH